MGLRGLDTLKIGLVYAIFILLFPLQTGSRPTVLKNGVDPSLFPDSRLPAVPDPVSFNHQFNPALLRFRRTDTLSQIYDGILDDGFIDSKSSKRGVVSSQHNHQFPASKVDEDSGITENKHVSVDDPTDFKKVLGLPEYIVRLKLTHKKWNTTTLLEKLQDIFPSSLIHLSYDKAKNTIEMYILKSGDGRHFLGAKEILSKLAASNLVTTEQTVQLDANQPQALPQQSDRGSPSQSSHQHFWHQVWFPYVAAGVSAFLIIIVLGVVICYVRYRKKKSEPTPSRRPTHICLYPVAAPGTGIASPVQPTEGQQYYVAQTFVTPVPAQPPFRIRAKGLLESRRGSSASLTIDLTPTVDVSKSGSPPRESPSREYLLSAGYRMTRKQLRKCLKNLKPLYDEFWEIPMNHPDRVNVAGSGLKNRYKTILPNEHTRIILEETDNDLLTSYINSNSIRGYAGEEKAYIATQGPISNTVYDFWRMLWQERTPCVIMITKLMEKGKMKCEQYFPLTPEEGTQSYEDIHVCVTDIAIKDGYEIRELKVTRDGYLNEDRKILHFWYTTWPDHKTPDSPKQLLGMVADVEKKRYDHDNDKAKGPVAVHCSAGIGRTGCFIAISIGVRQLQEEQMIDVLGIVCQMRLDRGGMVQNSEQYEFVHRALCMFEKTLPQSSPSGD